MSKWIGGIVPHLPQAPAAEAIRVTPVTIQAAAEWCGGDLNRDNTEIILETALGHQIAKMDDWIFRLEDGGFWPVSKPTIERAEALTILLDS